MSQISYTVANQTFPDTRTNLNAVFDAIKTLNAGNSEPPDTAAGMPWLDTSGGGAILKLRNADNTGWLTYLNLTTGIQFGGVTPLTSVGGPSTNVLTATAPSGITAYAVGQMFSFFSPVTNTSVVTLNINGIGARDVYKAGGSALSGLSAGDLRINGHYMVMFNGTQFVLVSSSEFITLRGNIGYNGWTGGNYLRATTATTLEQRTPAQVRSDISAASTAELAAAVPLFFRSSPVSWTAGGLVSQAHGLGGQPHGVLLEMTCTGAESGYSVGTVVYPALGPDNGSAIVPGTLRASTTAVSLRCGTPSAPPNAVAVVANGTTGVRAVLTAPNWAIRMICWRFQ